MEKLLTDLVIEEIYAVTTLFSDTGERAGRVDRPCWAVVYKYEGETVYQAGERRYVSNRDHIMVLPRGSEYRWLCTTAGHYAILEFRGSIAGEEIWQLPVTDGDELLRLFRRMEKQMLQREPLWQMQCLRDAYGLLLKIQEPGRREYISTDKSARLTAAVEHIYAHYNGDLCNDDLAALTGYSTVYFRKLFTSVYGIPPMEYVKKLRIQKAEEMLSTDHGSITDIATSLGYRTIFDFSRDFKKHTGLSPTRYSKKRHEEA